MLVDNRMNDMNHIVKDTSTLNIIIKNPHKSINDEINL